MYLMYVDESGDCGMLTEGSPSRFFCLSGLVVHELRWKDTLAELAAFRHRLYVRYKVNIEDELHAANMVNKPSKLAKSLQSLAKHERLAIIRQLADCLARLDDINLISVVVDKKSGHATNKDDVFRWAWSALFQRFENTIRHQNFPGPKNADDRGIIFPDRTDSQKLKRYLHSLRLTNPLKVRQRSGAFTYKDEPIRLIVEDAIMRDSRESYLLQAADCAAFLLKQSIEPSSYMKKHGGSAYFKRMEPVLCKRASDRDPLGLGVVRL